MTWTQFLRSQAAVACDFATVDTALLRRYYLLFFIDVTSREVPPAGITANPTGPWTTQAARNPFLCHAGWFVEIQHRLESSDPHDATSNLARWYSRVAGGHSLLA